jgi:putative NIF3 family GTP cyclohydrolase 1 type 2
MASRDDIDDYLKTYLEVDRFADYGPNGLQVEGRSEIRKVVSGVTASLALIEAALAAQADAIVVHHGLFWRQQDGRVTGWMKKRLAALLGADVNLFAFHLPLDAHPEIGNNARLAARMKFTLQRCFGDKDLGCIGTPPQANMTLAALKALVQFRLGREPLVIEGDGRPIGQVAWCTGGAQSYLPTPTSPAKSPKRRPTTPAKPAWPSSPAATMRRNATAPRRWASTWRRSSACSTSSSTSTIRCERLQPHHDPARRHQRLRLGHGVLAVVEDARREHRVRMALLDAFGQVLQRAHAAGGDHGHRHGVGH